MLSIKNPYNTEIPGLESIQEITEEKITVLLQKYLDSYKDCFGRSQQIRYFQVFVRGLLSNLDRKSIEPIALSFLGEKGVRGMQQFFTRSTGWYETLSDFYKEQFAGQLSKRITARRIYLKMAMQESGRVWLQGNRCSTSPDLTLGNVSSR